MATIGSLDIKITGDAAQLTKVLKNVQKKTGKTGDAIEKDFGKKSTSAVGKLTATLSKAGRVLGPMASGAAAAGAAVAAMGAAAAVASTKVFNWFESLSRSTRELQRNAKAAGIGVEEYQALASTFERFNADADDLQDALGTIADRAQDAAQGAQGPKEDFELLGIAVDDLRGKDPGDLLNTVADGLQSVEAPSKRMAAAARILGDDLARRLVPLLSEGEEGLRKFKEEAKESGQILSGSAVQGATEFLEVLERLQRTLDAVEKTIFATVQPAFQLIIDTVDIAANIFGDFGFSLEVAQRAMFGFVKQGLLAGVDGILALNRGFSTIIKGLSFFNDAIKASGLLIVAFGQGFEAVKAAVNATSNLIAGFVTDILGALIGKLTEAIGFLGDLADTAGLDSLSQALGRAQAAGQDFGDTINDFSSSQMDKANEGFKETKRIAESISDVLEMDVKTALDEVIKNLGNTNDTLRTRLERLRARLQAASFSRPDAPASPDRQTQPDGGGTGGEQDAQRALDITGRLKSAWDSIASAAGKWKSTIGDWLSSEGEDTVDATDDILQGWKNVAQAVGQVGSAISRLPGVSDKVGIAVEGITGAMITVLGTIQAAIAASTVLGTTLAAATGGLTLIAGIIGTVASLASQPGSKGTPGTNDDDVDDAANRFAKAYADEIERRDLMTTRVFIDSGEINRASDGGGGGGGGSMSPNDIRNLNDRLAFVGGLDS